MFLGGVRRSAPGMARQVQHGFRSAVMSVPLGGQENRAGKPKETRYAVARPAEAERHARIRSQRLDIAHRSGFQEARYEGPVLRPAAICLKFGQWTLYVALIGGMSLARTGPRAAAAAVRGSGTGVAACHRRAANEGWRHVGFRGGRTCGRDQALR